MDLGATFLRYGRASEPAAKQDGSPDAASAEVAAEVHPSPQEAQAAQDVEEPGPGSEVEQSPETRPIPTNIVQAENFELRIYSRAPLQTPAQTVQPEAAPEAGLPDWYDDWLDLTADGLDLGLVDDVGSPPLRQTDDTTPIKVVSRDDPAAPTGFLPDMTGQIRLDADAAMRELELRRRVIWGTSVLTVVVLLACTCLIAAHAITGRQVTDVSMTLARARVKAEQIDQVGAPLEVAALQDDLHDLIDLSEQANDASGGPAWRVSRWSTRPTTLRLLDEQRVDLALLAEAARPLSGALATIDAPADSQDLGVLSSAVAAYVRAARDSRVTPPGALRELALATDALQAMSAPSTPDGQRKWALCDTATSCDQLTIQHGQVTAQRTIKGSAADLVLGEVVLVDVTVDEVTSDGYISVPKLISLLLKSADGGNTSTPLIQVLRPVMTAP